MKNNKRFFKLSLIYFVAIICVAIIFILGYAGILQNDILSSFLIQIVVMFAIPLLMYLFLFKKSPKQTFQDCGFRKISSKLLGLSILLGLLLYILNTFVADAFQSFITLLGYEHISSSGTVTLNYQLLLKEFILSCILPGFCEEFLHRGIMLHAGKKIGNTRFFLVISSILFGLTHLNINQFFYASILGFLMGLASLASDSIYPAMIAHFMNNFLSNYFFYGTYLDFPLAKFASTLEKLFMNNIFTFVSVTTISIFLLIYAYQRIIKLMTYESTKMKMHKVIEELNMNEISIDEAQLKLNSMNLILKNIYHEKRINEKNIKFSLLSMSLLISSIILGSLVTISSFIWGII